MAINRTSPKKGKVVDIPDAVVTIGTPTAGDASVSVAFTASSPATGGPVQKYTAISNPGSFTGTATTSPVTVSGLTNGTAYTFTVAAGNATGNGVFSSASASVSPVAPTFQSIATVTLSGTASTFTFSSIPSTFKHLQIRGIALSNSIVNAFITFNGDTASNYNHHWAGGDGTNANTNNGINQTYIVSGQTAFNTGSNAIGAATIIDILDYSDTNKNKTLRALNGFDDNTSHAGYIPVTLSSGLWRSTAAITSVTLTVSGGYNWIAGSQMALYGIKG